MVSRDAYGRGHPTDHTETVEAPLGREKVITCYGILGVLSLATSKSSLPLYLLSRLAKGYSRLPGHHNRPNTFLSPPLPAHLPRYRLPSPPPLSLIYLIDHPRSPSRERAGLFSRARSTIRKNVVFVWTGLDE